ncbi:MAG: 50S ribosomal protein L11 [Thermoprotei archaeon]
MTAIKKLRFLVPAGKATPGPPIGPALGPTGVRTPQVVQKINEATKKYEGMSVSVDVTIDLETKEFQIDVIEPSVSSLILKKVAAEKGAATPHTVKVGNVDFGYVVELAKEKINTMNTLSLKAAVKTILSICRSIGVTVDGADAKELIPKVDAGEYDSIIGV